MVANNTCSKLSIWRTLFRAASAMIFSMSLMDGAHAQVPPINMEVAVKPEEITVLYFDAADKLLWVEDFSDVKSRSIVPIEDTDLMKKIPFASTDDAKPANHFDCDDCPEKKADLVTSGVASKAVYCAVKMDGGKAMAAPWVVEDLSSIPGRLIKLEASTAPSPCPFPKKCHCGGPTCCCY